MSKENDLSELDKIAVDQSVNFERALFDVWLHNDMRAMMLLSIYIALAGATIMFVSSDWFVKAATVTHKALILGYSITLLGGVYYAFRAGGLSRSSKRNLIHLPGRASEFWAVARQAPTEEAIERFLKESDTILTSNIAKQSSFSMDLKIASFFGIVSVLCLFVLSFFLAV